MANVILAYLFWATGGWFGLHHFYLGRDRQAFVWFCLFGGYGGAGWFADFFNMPRYVEEANFTDKYVQSLTAKMQIHPKPRFSLYRFFGQLAFGNLLAWIVYRAIPEDEDEPLDWPLTWLHIFIPLGAAIGVHTVGNIGREEGDFRWPLIGSYLPYLSYTVENPRYYMSTILAALCFRYGVKWNRKPPVRRSLFKRVLILGGCTALYLALWSSNLYYNVTITNEHGETIKFRDSVRNLLNSPLWFRFKDSLKRFWDYYWAYGWHNLWDEFVRSLDPLGEQNALSILGLPESATQKDITQRWRELSRKYHPDKFKSEKDKMEAQAKFMEIKEAYEKISVLQSKRKSHSSRSRGSA